MIIDGNKIAQEILNDLKNKVKKLKEKNIIPQLAIILIGNNPSSIAYINQKEIKSNIIGTKTLIKSFSINITEPEILNTIKEFNSDKNIHGIIVQQPLPKNLNTQRIINAVRPDKDVDGLSVNSNFEVPISLAVLKILENIFKQTPNLKINFIDWLKNKKITILGKGESGGKPIINTFQKMNLNFSVIDSQTKNPEIITKNSDIIISAVGKENVLKSEMLSQNVSLIGIGISRGKSAKLMGDYDQNKIKNIASFYTPTPGGVGPINVAMLLKNVIMASEKKH